MIYRPIKNLNTPTFSYLCIPNFCNFLSIVFINFISVLVWFHSDIRHNGEEKTIATSVSCRLKQDSHWIINSGFKQDQQSKNNLVSNFYLLKTIEPSRFESSHLWERPLWGAANHNSLFSCCSTAHINTQKTGSVLLLTSIQIKTLFLYRIVYSVIFWGQNLDSVMFALFPESHVWLYPWLKQ